MRLDKTSTKRIPFELVNFDQMPDSAFIRLPILKALYGVSSATIWRGVKNKTIPSPYPSVANFVAHLPSRAVITPCKRNFAIQNLYRVR